MDTKAKLEPSTRAEFESHRPLPRARLRPESAVRTHHDASVELTRPRSKTYWEPTIHATDSQLSLLALEGAGDPRDIALRLLTDPRGVAIMLWWLVWQLASLAYLLNPQRRIHRRGWWLLAVALLPPLGAGLFYVAGRTGRSIAAKPPLMPIAIRYFSVGAFASAALLLTPLRVLRENPYSAWMLAWSWVTLVAYGYDKWVSMRRQDPRAPRLLRIPELTLHLFAITGGFFGGVFAMLLFRHKIRRRLFVVVLTASAVLHGALWYGLGPTPLR